MRLWDKSQHFEVGSQNYYFKSHKNHTKSHKIGVRRSKWWGKRHKYDIKSWNYEMKVWNMICHGSPPPRPLQHKKPGDLTQYSLSQYTDSIYDKGHAPFSFVCVVEDGILQCCCCCCRCGSEALRCVWEVVVIHPNEGWKKQKQAPLTFPWGAQEQLSITCFLSLTFSVNTCLLESVVNNHSLKQEVRFDHRICSF